MSRAQVPSRFIEFAIGGTQVVCTSETVDAVRDALAAGTMFDYAARHPRSTPLAGRGTAYAVDLPGGLERIVVRHNRHGGLLAPLTRDLFLDPTRAPMELALSERLRALGVATPPILGYAMYPAPLGFRRADVWSREIPESADLSASLCSPDAIARRDALRATARVVAALVRAGAFHEDLNIKNILLRRSQDGPRDALVLDVDRVTFPPSSRSALEDSNLARFRRSALKWRTLHGAQITDRELDAFEREVREAPPPASTSS